MKYTFFAVLTLILAFFVGCGTHSFDNLLGKGECKEGDKCDDGDGKGREVVNKCTDGFRTVTIGTQTWMAENVNCDVEGSRCYNDNPANCERYGRFYNWETAMTICPQGWHLPTKEEWETLTNYVETAQRCSHCDIKYLKSSSGWYSSYNMNGNGSDTYGFAALPGGQCMDYARACNFTNIETSGYWWSATEHENNNSNSYYSFMHYSNNGLAWSVLDKANMYSVRCVKN